VYDGEWMCGAVVCRVRCQPLRAAQLGVAATPSVEGVRLENEEQVDGELENVSGI